MASGHSFETPLWRPLPLRHIHTPVSKPSWLRSFTGQFLFVHICAYLFHFFRNTSVAQTHADPNKYMNTGSTRLTLLYLREHCRGHRYWSQILLEPWEQLFGTGGLCVSLTLLILLQRFCLRPCHCCDTCSCCNGKLRSCGDRPLRLRSFFLPECWGCFVAQASLVFPRVPRQNLFTSLLWADTQTWPGMWLLNFLCCMKFS